MAERRIIVLERVDSTNNYAEGLLQREMPPEGTVVAANYQTAGKGTDGSAWISSPGENLTFSLILYPAFLEPAGQFLLNMGISLGVLDFVRQSLPGHTVRIKWPNDIYIGEKKAAGILIKNTFYGNILKYSIIGIGLNINQSKFPDSLPNPVSLRLASGRDFHPPECLNGLLRALDSRYLQLAKNEAEALRCDYLGSLYRLGTMHKYLYSGKEIRAAITGVSESGLLELRDEKDRLLRCDRKEIVYL